MNSVNTYLQWILIPSLVVTIGLSADKSAESAEAKLIRQVRHELIMLPYYGVFDNLSFRLKGRTVTLMGQVVRPSLKSDSARVVKDVDGVESVVNDIEVLPTSPNDDRIRLDTYRAIYNDNTLYRYGLQAVPPIHIVVRNGNVTLVGIVANQSDKNVAGIRASGVSGSFSVKNELLVESTQK